MKSVYVQSVFTCLLAAFLCIASSEPVHSQPLSGNYTINQSLPTGGTNFHSFNDFASALGTNGVSGPVIGVVVPGSGPYNEQVEFTSIPGCNVSAPVTLEGSGEVITALTNSADLYAIRLANLQYFNLNNLEISRNINSSYGFFGVHLFGACSYITISNCLIDINGTSGSFYAGVVASGSETSVLTTGDFHYISISGNTTIGGDFGISLFGLVTNLASYIFINGNEIIDYHSNGVYLRETDGAVVYGNHFDKITGQLTYSNAIQMAQAANINAQIFNNVIEISQPASGSATQRGIYLFNGTGHQVYNNVIHNIQLLSGSYTAIEIRTGGTSPEIYYNTISLDGTATTNGNLYGIKEELSNTNSILRNNMISISQPTTGIKSGLVIGSTAVPATAFNSNYNDIWVPNGNVAQKGTMTPTFYPTLANWQAISGQDANSHSLDPLFTAPMLSIPTNPAANDLGTPISWITTDIIGAARGTPPDIGAYEFSNVPPATPDTILGDTLVCANSNVPYFIMPVPGASSYNWTITGGGSILTGQGTTNPTVSFGNTNCTISVTASNANGSSSPASLNITVNQLPQVSLSLGVNAVCLNWPPSLLTGGSPPNGNYSGPGISAGVFTPSMAGAGNHTINYTYIDTNGCSATATDTLYVDLCTGSGPEAYNAGGVIICPNPFVQSTKIILPDEGGEFEAVSLCDASGRKIKSWNKLEKVLTLDREGMKEGMYFLLFMSKGHIAMTRKIILR